MGILRAVASELRAGKICRKYPSRGAGAGRRTQRPGLITGRPIVRARQLRGAFSFRRLLRAKPAGCCAGRFRGVRASSWRRPLMTCERAGWRRAWDASRAYTAPSLAAGACSRGACTPRGEPWGPPLGSEGGEGASRRHEESPAGVAVGSR